MKIKLLLIFLPLAILVGCSSSSCDDSKPTGQWHNCSGTHVEKGKGTYIGEWKHGEWNGKGELEFIDGEKYVGEFINGARTGQGTLTYASGGKYVGGWKNGKKHGQGTHTYPDGDKYVGEYKNGQRHGDGIMTFGSDGTFRGIKVSKIEGEWKNNNLNGIGFMKRDDGEWHYVGNFKDNKYHGHGTYFYYDVNNKDKFVGEWEGEWKNGKRNGHGTYTYSDGNKYDGVWKDDSFIYE